MIRITLLLSSLLFFVACSQAQDPVNTQKKTIVFRSVNVIPMDTERVLENQDVVVRGGRIISIDKAGRVKHSKDALLVDGKGKYLIPGLAEMHAHVPPVDDLEPMKEVLMLFACNGITTIRGMLGHPRHLQLRAMIKSGEIIGPAFYTSGPSFSGNTVSSPAAAVEMVNAQKKAGYDFLKLHPGLNIEKFNSIAQAAKTANIPFAGHVSFDVGIWRALDAGYATIDHMDGFVEALVSNPNLTEQEAGLFGMYLAGKVDTSRIKPLMNRLKQTKTWIVPTQALAERWMAPAATASFSSLPEMKYMNDQTLNNWINQKNNMMSNARYKPDEIKNYIHLRHRLIKACHDNALGLLLGSDAPQVFNVPGFSTHQELEYYVDAGLSPFQALQTGTVNVAKYYNATDRGMVKKGMVADLVLLNGNPLQNIKETQQIAGVMLGNRWLTKSYIDASLKKLEKR